jgi:hypothetical protein
MGSPTPDISNIRSLVVRARRRLRIQHALDGATLAVVLASIAALATVYAVRAYLVTPSTGELLLLGSAGLVVVGAVVASIRRIDDEAIARQIDRASNLSDRLSTAVAFQTELTREVIVPGNADDETRALMRAAIRDAIAVAPRADVRRATPFRVPRDLKVAGLFAGLALVAAGLGLPTRDPEIFEASPARGPRGSIVEISGKWLCGPDARANDECTASRHQVVLGADDVWPRRWRRQAAPVALDTDVIDWMGGAIAVAIPDDAPIGHTTLEVRDGSRILGRVPFEVIDPVEEKKKDPDALTFDDDDLDYTKDLLDQLRAAAERDGVPELEDFVKHVEALLAKAEAGELTKEQLLEELQKAKDALDKGEEPDPKEVDQDLAETGKELEKNQLTKELGKALKQGDLDKAKKEMEKLAEKMDKGELNEKQKQDLAKALEKAAKAYQKKDEQRQKDLENKIDKAQKEVRKLEKDKEDAKDPKQKQELERKLDKKKRELERLQKDKEKKDQSEQRRALKRLHKDLEKGAEDLQKKPDKDKSKDDQQKEDRENQRQASRKMKDAAEETGRVDKDKRKTAATKKVAEEMDDLREAMRRAKRRGAKGPQSGFGKKGKQSDFARRARGGKGQKGAWKPGGKGKGQGQNGGDASGKPDGPSNTWGTGHDPDLTGDPTAKSGDQKDQDLQGKQGKGPSRRETILSAAEKGFASKGYEQVYADYKRIVEEVMRGEKVPSSYKYYIKKYFTKIKPHSMD